MQPVSGHDPPLLILLMTIIDLVELGHFVKGNDTNIYVFISKHIYLKINQTMNLRLKNILEILVNGALVIMTLFIQFPLLLPLYLTVTICGSNPRSLCTNKFSTVYIVTI
jgi:hypothetical protein